MRSGIKGRITKLNANVSTNTNTDTIIPRIGWQMTWMIRGPLHDTYLFMAVQVILGVAKKNIQFPY